MREWREKKGGKRGKVAAEERRAGDARRAAHGAMHLRENFESTSDCVTVRPSDWLTFGLFLSMANRVVGCAR